MENKGLLFIPDISGFTRFVNETDIEHSRLIIQELLEVIISANQLGLEVSEIEGDAILFYKFGEPPSLEELYHQTANMFWAFHRNLIAYEQRRYCQCEACISAVHLTLKVVTHYGEFTGYNVRQFYKLIGKDVIVAHQLLKNDIEQHEYWLVTKDLLQGKPPVAFSAWMKWNSSASQTENGEVPFQYTQLGQLKNELPPEPVARLQLSGKAKMITVFAEYATDIITLFHASGDFNYRARWKEGVKKVEEVGHFLPRVGMRCRYITDHGEVVTTSNSYSFRPDKIEFSETEEKSNTLTCFTLEKTGEHTTRLTLDVYVDKSITRQLLFRLTQRGKQQENLRKSLLNLEQLVKELNAGG
jgi:hypothetical protein